MSAWTTRELRALDEALELKVTIPQPGGGMHGPVILWHGIVGDELYVRSARGARAAWFCCAVAAGEGILHIDELISAVRFQTVPADAVPEALDEVLHQRYDTFGLSPVAALTSSRAKDATLLVTPSRTGDVEDVSPWRSEMKAVRSP